MKCLLDLDGVLADFVSAACAVHGRPNVYDDSANHGRYGIDELMGLSANAFWKPCGEEFWAGLPPTKDGSEILSIVESKFGIDNICLLTSPNVNKDCSAGKMRWIAANIPAYKRRFLIGPQKHFCAHSGSVLIDDYDRNVDGFRDHGGQAVLLPRPWNSLHGIADPVGYLKEQLCSLV